MKKKLSALALCVLAVVYFVFFSPDNEKNTEQESSISELFSGFSNSTSPSQNSQYYETEDNSLMELPAMAYNDIILRHEGYICCYNTERCIPNWVAWELTEEESYGDLERDGVFGWDSSFKGHQAAREDYNNSGWDKGHMAPAGDMKWSEKAMEECFLLINICPQNHEFNKNDWNYLEKKSRYWAQKYGKLYIVCGPIVTDNHFGTIGDNKVTVPDGFFKVFLAQRGSRWQSIGFVFQNIPDSQPVRQNAHSVNEIEESLGYDFFPALSDKYEESVESQVNLKDWGL